QALLTKAMRLLFDRKQIPDIDWTRRDRDVMDLLARAPETKEIILRYFYGTLPDQLGAIRLNGSLGEMGFSSRDEAIEFVEQIAIEDFGIKKPFGYVFVDRAIFSKELEFRDPASR